MFSLIIWLDVAAFVVAIALSIYYLGDKPARRFFRNAAATAFGVTFVLRAALCYLDHSPRWNVWLYAALAVVFPILLIWDARRRE